ncbi:serine hydrolase domain-containing protein [Vagococcus sp. JNUCC 83]
MFNKTIQFIESMYQDNIIPGANYLFYKNNAIYKHTIGYRQLLPDKEWATENTIYDMASLTKVMLTNTMVLKLIEQNKIDIDEPFKLYLSSWHDDRVTLRHLLTHTSGITGYIKNRDVLSAEELKKALLSLPVNESDFGRKKVYTDTGTLLIGFMLEEMFGKTVQELFSEEILMPLNMSNSGFFMKDNPLCAPTELTTSRGLIKGDVHDPKAFQLQEHCASAGLFSTIDDSFKFVDMMLKKGKLPSGEPFLLQSTILELLQDYTPNKQFSRSLGWDLKYHLTTGHPILFHTGYTGTFMLIDIISQEAFIFLSNRVHPIDDKEAYLKKRDTLIEVFLKEQTET